jgi:DNA-binding SARP family transcriptional activator
MPGYQMTAHQGAQLLWPHHLERSALNSFNVALHGLRRLLEPELTPRADSRYVLRDGRTYRLCIERISCDAEDFHEMVCQGPSALDAMGARRLAAAVDLYEGDFLSSSAEDFVVERRAWLRRMMIEALDRLGDWHAAMGESASALAVYDRLLQMEPYREDVWGRLIEVHIDAGDDHEALVALQRCEVTLQDADIEPSGLLKELHHRLRGGRPRWERGRPLTASGS